jgi:hypothetical protein
VHVVVLQTVCPLSALLACQASPALAAQVREFMERVCGHGWCVSGVTGVAPGSRTVLVPHRYWVQDAGKAPSGRATLAAGVGDGTVSALVDKALSGSYEAVSVGQLKWSLGVPVEANAPDADAGLWRKPVPAKRVAFHWVEHGVVLEVPGHGLASFPPRCVRASVGGDILCGWIIGWDTSSGAALVARGLYPDPGAGSAVSLDADLAAGTVVVVPEAAIQPPAAATPVKAFLLDPDLCNGVGSSGHSVAALGPVRLPTPQSAQLPGAHFEHLRAHRVVSGACAWSYTVDVPGDIGTLFANKVLIGKMRELEPTTWDISAAIPCLQGCKRLRDAMPMPGKL